MPEEHGGEDELDVLIVGAGAAGLYLLHRLRTAGFRATCVEAAGGVGGTWYWNRYPGARCDVESMRYSFGFDEALQQEWTWTERYAGQPEILAYLDHVADRFDLRRDILLNTRVVSARYDEEARRWRVATDPVRDFSPAFVVMATGCLSAVNKPDIPGLDSFAGDVYRTGEWPHEPVDFTGRRVGVIGTGSTGIQTIPVVAREAAHLYVFQRSAQYSVPARNRPLAPDEVREVKADYPALRALLRSTPTGDVFAARDVSAVEVPEAERTREFERRWAEGGIGFMASFRDLVTDEAANRAAQDFARARIREIVRDPAVADRLCPDTIFGGKRLCLDSGYFETFNRPNVTLVDLTETPIERIVPAGVKTTGVRARETEPAGGPTGGPSDGFSGGALAEAGEGIEAGERGGTVHEIDALIFATGFDAMTGALARIDIRGRSGRALADKWADGPRTYLGLAVAGFPNLFTVTGPGSPSVLSNMMTSIEQHVDWIAGCLEHLRETGAAEIEADDAAEDAWVRHVGEVAAPSLRAKVDSWYLGANIPGKPRVFMPYLGGVNVYRDRCDEVASEGYRGFRLSA